MLQQAIFVLKPNCNRNARNGIARIKINIQNVNKLTGIGGLYN